MVSRFAISSLIILSAGAQDSPFFRTGISLARVDVEVAEHGKPLDGLLLRDFEVREDGHVRPIGQLAVEQERLDLLLLLDVSGSMEPHIHALLRGVRASLQRLRPGDRVSVATFNDQWRMRLKLTYEFPAVEAEIATILRKERFRRGTDTYFAVRESARYMHKNGCTDCRRAVIMLTDNLSRPSLKYEKVLKEVLEADLLFSVLLLPVPWHAAEAAYGDPERSADVTRFARETAGDVVRGPAVGSAFSEMLERLRRRYALYFKPRPGEAGQPRRLDISLSPQARENYPAARIRARREYTLTASVVE